MAEDYGELLVVNALIVMAIALCEMRFKVHASKLIQYDRVELTKPEKREELIADLEARTGLKIIKVDVGGVDFLKDTVVLRVTYDSQETSEVDNQFRVRKSQWREL